MIYKKNKKKSPIQLKKNKHSSSPNFLIIIYPKTKKKNLVSKKYYIYDFKK